MSEKLNKVAKAIYYVSCKESDNGELNIPNWDNVDCVTKSVYREMASAAIRSLEGVQS